MEKNIIKQIISYLKVGRRAPSPYPARPPNGAAWGKFIQALQETDDVEIPCDEVFALLDRFAELEVSGEDAARLLPLVQKHLDRCGDCLEEYAGLVNIIGAAAGPGG